VRAGRIHRAGRDRDSARRHIGSQAEARETLEARLLLVEGLMGAGGRRAVGTRTLKIVVKR